MVPAREPPLRSSGGWFNDHTVWAAQSLECPVLSPDGRRLAVVTGAALLLVDVAQGEPIASITNEAEGGLDCGLTFSADGSLLTAVGRGEVKIWEIPSGRLHSARPRRETAAW